MENDAEIEVQGGRCGQNITSQRFSHNAHLLLLIRG